MDPVARRISVYQEARTIPFTGVVYPEVDPQFWTVFDPVPPPEAVPYLFVAGGYTVPLVDWPESVKRSVFELRARPERPAWEALENEPG